MSSKQNSFKKFGPYDRRLRISRCAGCRRARTGCDGKRPCARCQSRGIPCVEANPTHSTDVVFLAPTSVAPPSGLAALPGCIMDSFFSFIGNDYSTSPFTSAFEKSFIETELRTSEPLRSLVTAIANLGRKAGSDESLNLVAEQDSGSSGRDREVLKNRLRSSLPQPGVQVCQSALLFAVLFCLYETMTDATGLGFFNTLEHLSRLFKEHPPSATPESYPNKCLMLVYELMECIRALIMDESTYLADVKPLHSHLPQDESATRDVALFQSFTESIIALSRANNKSTQWVTQARRLATDMPSNLDTAWWTSTLAKNGMIQSGASAIADGRRAYDLIDNLRPTTQHESSLDACDFASLQFTLYHYGLISVARLFTDPLWLLVDENPPGVDQRANFAGFASAKLERLEARLPYAGVESFLFLPLLLVAALEVDSTEDKARIVKIVHIIGKKGFIVAETYMADINLAWQFGERLAYTREHKPNGKLNL